MACWSGSFPCMVYIDSSHRDTISYEWQFIVAVISYYVWCTVDEFEELDMHMVMIILPL
jgi:hypothetical protein